MTELEIIRDQFNEFREYSFKIPSIKNYIYPKMTTDEFGEKTSKFTIKNYMDRYDEIVKDKQYQILFKDESLISLYYKFNSDGDIIQHNLSFIPSIDNYIILEEDGKEVNRLLMNSFTDYFRIDFDKTGYQEITHCENHAHIGLKERRKKKNAEIDDINQIYYENAKTVDRNEIRFPVKHVIYPYDFIYIICKYVYHDSNKVLDSLKVDLERRVILTDLELELLNIGFKS